MYICLHVHSHTYCIRTTMYTEYNVLKKCHGDADDVLAQAMCRSLAEQKDYSWGRVYAVGKYCAWPQHLSNCDHICGHHTLHTDTQTTQSRWSCIGAFHVFYSRPATRKDGRINTATLGLTSVRTSCNYPGCGPNFCCCIADG